MRRVFFVALLYVIVGISAITHMIGLFTTSLFVAGLISFISFIAISGLLFYTLNQKEELQERYGQEIRRARATMQRLSQELGFHKNVKDRHVKQIDSLSSQLAESQNNYSLATRHLNECLNKLNRLELIYPDIDAQLDFDIAEEQKKIDTKAAADYDTFVSPIINKPASPGNESLFKETVDRYEELTDTQKELIQSDIAIIRDKYDQCRKLRWQQEQQRRRRREEEERRRRQRADEDARRRRRLVQNTVFQILRS